MTNRLYRSSKEKMIGGVCGGIAEYFDVTTDDLLGREKPRRLGINIEDLSEEAREDLMKYLEFLRTRYSKK